MASFSYNTAAELFPAAIRKKNRAGFAYRRFGPAAEAVRFALAVLPAESRNRAYLQGDVRPFATSATGPSHVRQDAALPPRPRRAHKNRTLTP